jgi:Beta-eliminating lyase
MWGCERWLGARRSTSAADLLRAAADALGADARPDRYGDGTVVGDFESRLAAVLGKESAVLMPSGTMTQQIALRIHCERRGVRTVAVLTAGRARTASSPRSSGTARVAAGVRRRRRGGRSRRPARGPSPAAASPGETGR